MRIRAILLAGLASILATTSTPLPAQELTVAGRVPEDPLVILAVPDAADAWKGFSGSMFGRTMISYFVENLNANSTVWRDFQEQRGPVETDLGFSLSPDSLFRNQISGFDLYVVSGDDRHEVVVNLRFRELTTPNFILDRLRKEAFVSTGVAYGRAADSIEERENAGRRELFLPAFNLYLASEGNVLMAASSEYALYTAVNDAGGELVESAEFSRLAQGIEGEKHNAWLYGAVSELSNAIEHQLPMKEQAASLDQLGKMMAIDLQEDYYRVVSFQPRESLGAAELRYTTSAQPPGDVPGFKTLPRESLFAFSTNHFDTELLLGLLGEKVPENNRQSVEQGLSTVFMMGQSQMGEKTNMRQDVLSNLGPDLGFALTEFSLPQGGMSVPPKVDFLLTIKLRDLEKTRLIFENILTRQTEARAQGQTSSSGELMTSQHSGEKVYWFSAPMLDGMGYSPAWTVTEEGWLLFSAKRQSLQEAIERIQSGSGSIEESRGATRSASLLGENKNTVGTLNMAPVVDLLRAGAANQAANMPADEKAATNFLLGLLGTIESVGFSTRYLQEGVKREAVFLM